MIRPIEMIVQPGRRVARDFWANRRTGATFLAIIALWCLASSFIFWIVERDAWRIAQSKDVHIVPLTIGRAIYFTAMNVTTVGFGDVVPRTSTGEVIAVINGLAGLLLFGFLVAAATASLQPGSPDAEPARVADPRKGEGSNEGGSSASDDLLDAVTRLIASSRRDTKDRDGVVLELGVHRHASETTTIHVIVHLDHQSSTDQDRS